MMIFSAVVRHGSFRACAENIGVSQVVVSAHIRELESRLGVALFNRHPGHAAELTDQGQHAFNRISAILTDIADLRQELAGEHEQRQIKITTYSFIMLKLQDRLDAFRDMRPHVNLHIDLDPPDNMKLALQVNRGDVDIGCFFSMADNEVPESTIFSEEKLAIYVGPDHPLANVMNVTGDQLQAHPAIMLTSTNPQRRLTDRALGLIGASPANILMETDALALMLSNVRKNRAWICLFQDSVDDMLPGLKRVNLAKDIPAVQVRMLMRSSARHDANLRALQRAISGAKR
ncbi:MAG: LysR family transcriptional regulator [Sphingobium sp.]|nr:LysR family transcriptional regulator [Sphingobium sp.]